MEELLCEQGRLGGSRAGQGGGEMGQSWEQISCMMKSVLRVPSSLCSPEDASPCPRGASESSKLPKSKSSPKEEPVGVRSGLLCADAQERGKMVRSTTEQENVPPLFTSPSKRSLSWLKRAGLGGGDRREEKAACPSPPLRITVPAVLRSSNSQMRVSHKQKNGQREEKVMVPAKIDISIKQRYQSEPKFNDKNMGCIYYRNHLRLAVFSPLPTISTLQRQPASIHATDCGQRWQFVQRSLSRGGKGDGRGQVQLCLKRQLQPGRVKPPSSCKPTRLRLA